MPFTASEEQIVIIAPLGHDAAGIAAMLQAEDIPCVTATEPEDCLHLLPGKAGVLLITEEVLNLASAPEMLSRLKTQPEWSVLPVIVLTSGGETRLAGLLELTASASGGMTLLERPMSAFTLLRSVQVALQSRRRQYQMRDLLAELQRSEQRYRLLFDRNPDGVFAVDRTGRFTMVNPACEKISGYSAAELLSKRFVEICAPDQCAATLAHFQETTLGPRYSELETALVRKDGRRVDVWIASEAIASEGQVNAVHCTAKDITERKRAERELRQLNAILSAINRSTPALIAMKDLQGRVTFCNPAVLELTGRCAEQVIGFTDADLYGAEVGAIVMAHDRRVMSTGKTEVFQETANGRTFHLTKTPYYSTDNEEEVAGVIVVGTDITDLTRAQEALKNQQLRLSLAMEAGKLVPWEVNLLTGEALHSEGLFDLFGVDPAAGPRSQWYDLVLEEDREAIRRSIEAAATGSEHHVEYRVRVGSGAVRWHEAHGLPLADAQGRYTRLVGFSRDITARKDFQAELERLVVERTARLQELVNELEHFSYSITHDMRAPLRSMAGFVEMAVELCGSPDVEQQKLLLRRIGQSTARMDTLITDALSYSEAVRKHLPLAPVDPNQLLRGMLDSYPEFALARAHIKVVSNIPLVFANEAGLTQCFSNLLNNAIKFAKPGQVPQIRIGAERVESPPVPRPDPTAAPKPYQPAGFAPVPALPVPDHNDGLTGQWVRIWVEDEGIGISKNMLPRIFNMFSRGTGGGTGNGIGLALVRKVVDRMGGRVGVESREGAGSRFWIDLMPAERA